VKQEAFDEWVSEAAPRLHRAAFLLTGDWATAQDLVQHACAATWPRFNSLEQPEAFARTVMARTSSSWWRRRWRGEVPHGDLPEPLPDDPWSRIDRSVAVRRALLTLPPRQRSAVVLRFLYDLSEAETAAALGWPLGTVKSTTARALVALRHAGLTDMETRS
jgi:RNA polymerase sigma-70 factor (sigma-E family)